MALSFRKRLFAAVLTGSFLISGLGIQAMAVSLSEMYSDNRKPVSFSASVEGDYSQKLSEYEKEGYAPAKISERISVGMEKFVFNGNKSPEYKEIDGKSFSFGKVIFMMYLLIQLFRKADCTPSVLSTRRIR